jgi:hypothetical protein
VAVEAEANKRAEPPRLTGPCRRRQDRAGRFAGDGGRSRRFGRISVYAAPASGSGRAGRRLAEVKEDIRRYFHSRFHREDSVFRDFRSEHYPPETALTVGPLVMS